MPNTEHLKLALRRPAVLGILTVAAALSAGCSRPIEVQGSVFIVTQGVGAYPLALVEIDVYAADEFHKYLDSSASKLDGFQNSKTRRLSDMAEGLLLKPLAEHEALTSRRVAASQRVGNVRALKAANALLESLDLGRKQRTQEQLIREGLETLRGYRKLHVTHVAEFAAQMAPPPLFRI